MIGYYTYLASPYTHADPDVMEQRYRQAMLCTCWYLQQRLWIYSPIVHCHALAKSQNLPRDHKFWGDYNFTMLRQSHGLTILAIEGWEESKGIAQECEWAHDLRLDIEFVTKSAFLGYEHDYAAHKAYEKRRRK